MTTLFSAERTLNLTIWFHPTLRRIFLWTIVTLLWSSSTFARDYFVATNGSDSDPGTLEQPFLTIQKAAGVMAAGDTTFVRAGTYRETVIPARSGNATAPITFRPYNGETVTVSGADVIPSASWTLSSGKIYQAPISWDLGEGANQIFLDGQMMIEARWPNTSLDVSHPTLALTTGGSFVPGAPLSTGTITDSNLPSKPADYWKGATIHASLGLAWTWQTGTVTTSAPGQISFTWSQAVASTNQLTPGPKNPYYLTGKLSELDAAGEWFRDGTSSTLYLWTPAGDSPAQHFVEAKRRQLAFDLSNRSFIVVQGFNLFAATITSDANSVYLVLDGLKAQYVSHFSLNPGGKLAENTSNGSGIVLNGKNHVFRNSTIAFSAGNGVEVTGSGHRVFNNIIHDTDYTATSHAAPVEMAYFRPTTGFLIAWNTLYNTARDGIDHTNTNPASLNFGRILHNEIYNYGLQTSDLGCTYSSGTDGKGTEIAYNLCHDSHALSGFQIAGGVYVDNDSSNFIVHHNVVWNLSGGNSASLFLNSVSSNNKVYNNTFAGSSLGFNSFNNIGAAPELPGTEVKNNIFTARFRYQPINASVPAVLQNNILTGTDPQFINPVLGNFQLKPTSPAIGAGVAIPPYTDGFTGRAPDIGAYDHGLQPWRAGAAQPIAASVSAASYGTALTPDSIAVAFGAKLATGSATPSSATLPTSLAGTTVTITDGAGVDNLAPLFYVTPTQIAFLIPPSVAPGVALMTITAGDGTISLASAPLVPVAPGLFSADASGSGLAAAGVVRVRGDGSQSNESASSPIDLGPSTDQVILIFYGTGIRGHSASSTAAQVRIGGVQSSVLYAGAQPGFAGLDQVNVMLPRSLAGRGNVDVSLTVDGLPANTVTINVR